MAKPRVYIDSCCFIDMAKIAVSDERLQETMLTATDIAEGRRAKERRDARRREST